MEFLDQYLDLVLLALALIEVLVRKINFTIKFSKFKKYKQDKIANQRIVSIIGIVLGFGYYLYKIFIESGSISNYQKSTIGIVVTLIIYYCLYDLLIAGIFYTNKQIYIKKELINIATIIEPVVYKENGFYYFEFKHKVKHGHIPTYFKIKDELKAYPILAILPSLQE